MKDTVSEAASLLGKRGAAKRNINLSEARRKEIAAKGGRGGKGKPKKRGSIS